MRCQGAHPSVHAGLRAWLSFPRDSASACGDAMQNDSMNVTGASAEQIALIAQVSNEVARHVRLSPDDALDFGQIVQLKMIERDYAPLRRFEERSSLKTYLTVVIRRLLW